MILQNIKQIYNATNSDLAKIMKCTEEHVENLINHDEELMVDELVRVCNYYRLSSDALNLAAYQAMEDNREYYRKYGLPIRERYTE